MPIPSIHAVRQALDPLEHDLREIITGAWQDWMGSSQRGQWRCARSRANFVWEQMIYRAHAKFTGHPSVKILSRHETFWFLAGSNVVMRLKKGDQTGLSSNIPTQLAIDFCDPEKDLFGHQEFSKVDVVYVLNSIQTMIADILVVARNGASIAWAYSVLESAVTALPIAQSEIREVSTESRGKRLVRAKKLEDAAHDQSQG